jgi:signal transduction histidine kinase
VKHATVINEEWASHSRRLGGRLIAAQEVERRRIARELHDDLSQRLALLSLELERLTQTQFADPVLSQRLDRLTKQASEIAADVHRLSHRLHPAKFEMLGLVSSIQTHCREVADRHAVEVEFSHARVPATVPPEVSLCVFRVVQEALHNVVKHSAATHARVRLAGTAAGLQIEIADGESGSSCQGSEMGSGSPACASASTVSKETS